jgi:hypothetical protein
MLVVVVIILPQLLLPFCIRHNGVLVLLIAFGFLQKPHKCIGDSTSDYTRNECKHGNS